MSGLTVIICAHNPRKAYISEMLAALRAQTLPLTEWDLLIVDNASQPPLASILDLSWHPHARIVREEKLGTAHARLCALRDPLAGKSDLILFVDDDNVLAPGYLAEGLKIGREWPQLGCWGGQLLPRYEVEPPPWLENYKKLLAIYPLSTPMWANRVHSYDLAPPTAGCFLRKPVWEKYLELVIQNPLRLTLGACGQEQVRGEDTDLVLAAIDIGLGLGRFPQLSLEHIMPAGRITVAYLDSLIAGVNFGGCILDYIREGRIPAPVGKNWLDRVIIHLKARRLPEPMSTFYKAELRGRKKAALLVDEWRKQKTSPPA